VARALRPERLRQIVGMRSPGRSGNLADAAFGTALSALRSVITGTGSRQ
jgi:hypothetical protein